MATGKRIPNGSRGRALAAAAVLTLLAGGREPGGGEFGIDFERHELDNGLEVILHVDDSDPLAAVAMTFHVWLGARETGAHRLRPPLRAPLLPRFGEPGPRRARQAHDPDRQLHQRLHQPRPHQLLRGRPDRRAGKGALGRGRQARLLHQHRDRIGRGEGEAGRQEREAAERRQPPVRAQQLRHRPGDVPGEPPLPLAG